MQRGRELCGGRDVAWARRRHPAPQPPAACETPVSGRGRGLCLRGPRRKEPGASLCELTPTSGDVLPHFWQRKPMLPMKVSRLTPLRRRRRGNGKSVIRPQLQVSRKNV